MEKITTIAESIPFIKKIAESRNIKAAYILIALSAVSFIVIITTFIGSALAGMLCLYMPLRDSLLSVRSPNPKVGELKKLLVVFIAFSGFYLLEIVGIKKIIPLFNIFKLLILFWIGFDEKHANAFSDMVLSKIPTEWLQKGNSIETAVKNATKTIEDNISIKKGGVAFKLE